MYGYTTLFSALLASTVWRESKETRLLWITLLAMANRRGVAEASVPTLAEFARLTVEETRASLNVLQSPDPDSRTPDHEGRRIRSVEGGWLILNHEKYRARLHTDERREYKRLKQAAYRAVEPTPAPAPDTPVVCREFVPVPPTPDTLRAVPPARLARVAVRDELAVAPPPPVVLPDPPFEPPFELTDEIDEPEPDTLTEDAARDVALMMERFDRFWTAYPRHTAKSLALKSFRRLAVSDTLLDIILSALAIQIRSLQWTDESGRYIPHPSTWLNQARWNDELEQAPTPPLAPHHIRKLGPPPLEQTWYKDCAALHGGQCQTGPAHRLRCQIDAIKGEPT